MPSLLKLKQDPIIEYKGIEDISKMIEERIAALNIEKQVANSETVKSLKAMRTTLNKEFKEYEEQRKFIKNALLTPYNELEAKYKVLIAKKYEEADTQLRTKIFSVEDKIKQNKEDKLTSYFAELCISKDIDFVEFKDAGINVTLSASDKSLREQVDAYVSKLHEEVKTISVLPEDDEFKAEVITEYKATKDLNHSIKIVQDRREAKAAELKRREEAKAAEEARRAEEASKAKEAPKREEPKVAEPLQAPTVEEKPKQYETQFKVKGTLEQLKALKAYIQEAGIEIL